MDRNDAPGRGKARAATALKTIAFRTGLHRWVFYRYEYMFRPSDLAILISCLTDTHGLRGPILELGCAAGHTTVFLNKHLDDLDDRRRYVCIDTFEGFTDEDIALEEDRGKDPAQYRHIFRSYRKDWFERTMRNNGITRVQAIKADVNTFDFGDLREVSFCLIDVDLRRPVEHSLEQVIPRMAPGGIIVVDDCKPADKFDGALSAYLAVVERHRFPVVIENEMLGVIRIPGG
jgi:O-methyltransferase